MITKIIVNGISVIIGLIAAITFSAIFYETFVFSQAIQITVMYSGAFIAFSFKKKICKITLISIIAIIINIFWKYSEIVDLAYNGDFSYTIWALIYVMAVVFDLYFFVFLLAYFISSSLIRRNIGPVAL